MKGLIPFLMFALPLAAIMLFWELFTLEPAASPTPRPVAVRPAPVQPKPVELPRPEPARTETPPEHRLVAALVDWTDAIRRGESTTRPAADRAAAADLLEKREFARAERAYDRLLVEHPSDVELLLGKAGALVGQARHDDALVLLDRAAELAPDRADVLFNRGVVLTRLGQGEEAVSSLQKCVAMAPQNLRARYNLAALYAAMERHADALPLWRELTEPAVAAANPELSRDALIEAWRGRGTAALDAHLGFEAIHAFERLVELAPRDVRGWLQLGIARTESGRRAAAIEALETALAIEPTFVPAVNQLAYVHALIYRDTESADARERVVQLCDRSLGIVAHQPRVRELRDTMDRLAREETQ